MIKKVKINLTEDVTNQVIQSIRQIEAALPFLVNLTPYERQKLPKMGRKRMKFVDNAHGYSVNQPNLTPQYLDSASWTLCYDGTKKLFRIMEALEPLWEKISDTYYAAGAESYAWALIFYKYLKAAEKARIPGIDVIIEELGGGFVRTPKPETVRKRIERNAEKKVGAAAKAAATALKNTITSPGETDTQAHT